MPMLELDPQQIDSMVKAEDCYDNIRSNIQFIEKDIKMITVTSVQAGEGKTTTSTALALSFARAGYKTLLIYADIRKAMSSDYFIEHGRVDSLTAYLLGYTDFSDILCATNVENLLVVPSGRQSENPPQMLQSKAFSDMLGEAREVFDYIIIDTPPVGLVADAAMIAQKCDGVILVTASGKTKRQSVLKAKEQLEKSGTSLLGIILNKVNAKLVQYDSYGDYEKYGYAGVK